MRWRFAIRPAIVVVAIYWVSSASGKLDSPVVGGFEGNRGEFYGEDRDGGRPVKVRYAWVKLDADHARRAGEAPFTGHREKREQVVRSRP